MERHGLRLPMAAGASNSTGRLSPMAFLVGVSWGMRGRSPLPDASSDLDRRLHSMQGRRWPIQVADASPSPLVRGDGPPPPQGEASSPSVSPYTARCRNAGASGQKMRAVALTRAGSPVVSSRGGAALPGALPAAPST